MRLINNLPETIVRVTNEAQLIDSDNLPEDTTLIGVDVPDDYADIIDQAMLNSNSRNACPEDIGIIEDWDAFMDAEDGTIYYIADHWN